MEVELDKLVKEKEKNVPMEVIPLDVVPITGTIETTTTITEIPATTSTVTTDASEKLSKSMQDMSLNEKEIRRLQDKIKKLPAIKFHLLVKLQH
jgi:hypothetical protein